MGSRTHRQVRSSSLCFVVVPPLCSFVQQYELFVCPRCGRSRATFVAFAYGPPVCKSIPSHIRQKSAGALSVSETPPLAFLCGRSCPASAVRFVVGRSIFCSVLPLQSVRSIRARRSPPPPAWSLLRLSANHHPSLSSLSLPPPFIDAVRKRYVTCIVLPECAAFAPRTKYRACCFLGGGA